MHDEPFSGEQQEYLKGFMAGVEARRGALGLPASPVAPAAAAETDINRAAQDRVVAAGGKLAAEEEAKRKKHPLDRFGEISALAAAGGWTSFWLSSTGCFMSPRRRMRSCAACASRAGF